jgi:hypothetical protein
MVGKKPSKDTLRAMANPPESRFSNHARAHGFSGSAMPAANPRWPHPRLRQARAAGEKSGLKGPTSQTLRRQPESEGAPGTDDQSSPMLTRTPLWRPSIPLIAMQNTFLLSICRCVFTD